MAIRKVLSGFFPQLPVRHGRRRISHDRRSRCVITSVDQQLEERRLLAATLTRFDSPVGSPNFSNEFVRMDLGDFKVDIDTRYGGTPSQ